MGKVIEFDLKRMTVKARLIIVGSVTKVVETLNDDPYGKGVASIEVEEVIKGGPTEKHIDVHYAPRAGEEAGFLIGDRCVFFITDWKGNPHILQGYAGKIPIEEGYVRVLFIRGEEKKQALEHFIQRIRDVMKGL
ncbi:MAG: hypothetical protein AB1512_10290 [Thermodesulfobacteriota bacterium]